MFALASKLPPRSKQRRTSVRLECGSLVGGKKGAGMEVRVIIKPMVNLLGNGNRVLSLSLSLLANEITLK
jgi:hypothetical protein